MLYHHKNSFYRTSYIHANAHWQITLRFSTFFFDILFTIKMRPNYFENYAATLSPCNQHDVCSVGAKKSLPRSAARPRSVHT